MYQCNFFLYVKFIFTWKINLLSLSLKKKEVNKSSGSGGVHEPNARAYLSISEKNVTSATQMRTINPKWHESHYFFIENPETETLSVKVKDEKSGDVLASGEVAIACLLNEPDLTLDRGFGLNCLKGGKEAKLYMKLSLRVSCFCI